MYDTYSVDELTSETPAMYSLVVRDGLYTSLYIPQIKFWNNRLRKLSEKNLACYSRADEAFNLDDQSFVGIFWDGEAHNLIPEDDDDDPVSPYCLELFPNDPEMLEEMRIIAAESKKLIREEYEVKRFLAGLLTFEPCPKDLHKILGDGLFLICQNVLRKAGWDISVMEWAPHEPAALRTFLEEHKPIVTAMQQRVLLNMITV